MGSTGVHEGSSMSCLEKVGESNQNSVALFKQIASKNWLVIVGVQHYIIIHYTCIDYIYIYTHANRRIICNSSSLKLETTILEATVAVVPHNRGSQTLVNHGPPWDKPNRSSSALGCGNRPRSKSPSVMEKTVDYLLKWTPLPQSKSLGPSGLSKDPGHIVT